MDWKAVGIQLARIGLPLLGGALGGPAGAAVGQALASALGLATSSSPEQVAAALGNLNGEQLVALRALEVDLAKAQLAADVDAARAQTEVNTIEAAQPGMFKGGWRPFAGWMAVIMCMAYPLARTMLPWSLQVLGVQGVPPLPPLDTAEAFSILLGMLGLVAARSTERVKGMA